MDSIITTKKNAAKFILAFGKYNFDVVKFNALVRLLVDKKIISGDEIRKAVDTEMKNYTKRAKEIGKTTSVSDRTDQWDRTFGKVK